MIHKRATFDHISIFEVYEKTAEVFYSKDYYEYLKKPQGTDRKKIEKIPEAAFREAIANALIHRAMRDMVIRRSRISMFSGDRIEIISPGGLPSGIAEDEYLSGKLSIFRNRNLGNVFYRLGFVEIFGTRDYKDMTAP
ncbi:MAG: ATP-binding protein [Sellimonas intestinalis]